MATFFLLPPQQLLEDHFRQFLESFFPGLTWPEGSWPALAELIDAALANQPDAYAVFREELPEGEPVAAALRFRFGAEPGDAVVEVRSGSPGGPVAVQSWRLGGPWSGGPGHLAGASFQYNHH
jgi:hypothetical protein